MDCCRKKDRNLAPVYDNDVKNAEQAKARYGDDVRYLGETHTYTAKDNWKTYTLNADRSTSEVKPSVTEPTKESAPPAGGQGQRP